MSNIAERVVYRFGGFVLDDEARALMRGSAPVLLTPKEYETLRVLVESAGKAVSKETIIEAVWPDTFVGDGSLARNVSVLRRQLGADSIETVPKFGYRFALPVAAALKAAPTPVAPALPQAPQSVPAEVADRPGLLPEPPALSYRWKVLGPVGAAALGLIGVAALGLAAMLDFNARRPKPPEDSPAGPVRLAVLPFRNASPDTAQSEYLRNGFEDELDRRLGRFSYAHLRVLTKGSTSQYRDTAKSPAQIGNELGARYLLEGTVAFAPERTRVTAELVDTADQTILWSREYVRPSDGLMAVQEEIVDSVGRAIHVDYPGGQPEDRSLGETSSSAAHDEYLLGRYEFEQQTVPTLRRALQHFTKATTLDPEYA